MDSAIRRASSALVPTGTVLLTTIVLGECSDSAIWQPTSHTPLKSAPPVVALRSPDGNENDLRLADSLGELGCERQSTVTQVSVDKLTQTRLVNRDSPLCEALDLTFDLVDTYDVIPALGKAGSLHQSDVSGSDDCDLHCVALWLLL